MTIIHLDEFDISIQTIRNLIMQKVGDFNFMKPYGEIIPIENESNLKLKNIIFYKNNLSCIKIDLSNSQNIFIKKHVQSPLSKNNNSINKISIKYKNNSIGVLKNVNVNEILLNLREKIIEEITTDFDFIFLDYNQQPIDKSSEENTKISECINNEGPKCFIIIDESNVIHFFYFFFYNQYKIDKNNSNY